MVRLYKDPKGDTIFKNSNIGMSSNKQIEYGSEINNLRRRIKELEDEVQRKEVDNLLTFIKLAFCSHTIYVAKQHNKAEPISSTSIDHR